MRFSVLMSIYYKEKPEYFNRAMQSIWDEQTIKPDEIVLVQDGKLTEELYEIIDKWKNKLDNILKVIPLEENLGLGNALNEGIKHCSYELIARMDADDIALPHRFEKQLQVFENSEIDVCSSWVGEFDNDEKKILSYRKVPEYHDDIIKFAKKRTPINHPAVMYKKSVVEKVGGYNKNLRWLQDYHLWARMILNGAKFYNIQESLVNMRTGYAQLERRRGLKYAIYEIKVLKELKDMGFLSNLEFMENTIVRFTVRILPKSLLKHIYKVLRN